MSLGGKGHNRRFKSLRACNISFYNDPPLYEIDIDYFKEVCFRRLKLLREIESEIEKTEKHLSYEQVSRICKNNNLLISGPSEISDEVIEADIISHFLLRLSFSRTTEK